MLEQGAHVVVAGVSARPFAVSAARAGYRVTAIDTFGDRDLRAVADVVALHRAGGMPCAARRVRGDAVAYGANFENHPEALAHLVDGQRLLGNSPEVVARVRRPAVLMRALRAAGIAVPETRRVGPPLGDTRQWLLKPRRSGGGHGTTPWRHGLTVRRDTYVQEWIPGVPGSITFAADGRQAVPLGLSRQIVGDPAFGGAGFRYCGSLLGPELFDEEERLRERAAVLAATVTAEFGLVGVNGIDFIARDGIPYPIEVNPRYSASMELVERAHGVSMFEVHARACGGELPAAPLWDTARRSVEGKAIVFAECEIRMRSTDAWLDDMHADVPHSGERIGRGRPICTVFARERDADACYRALKVAGERAARCWDVDVTSAPVMGGLHASERNVPVGSRRRAARVRATTR